MSQKGSDAMPESLQAQLVKNDTRVLVAFWRKRGERPSHEEILNYNYDRALSTLHWRGGPQYARVKACVTHMLTPLACRYRIWVKV